MMRLTRTDGVVVAGLLLHVLGMALFVVTSAARSTEGFAASVAVLLTGYCVLFYGITRP